MAALAALVLAHAGNEEWEEFTALCDSVSREELLRMANSLEAAEQVVSNGRMP
ncbi:hypothetical protein ACFPIJ_26205 [Dactylosporangium cerinum]|uniref:Uncharacterized protein n=1 Tax=Dactylosporangium cerinum TaxID=1434730 RepID=A0ABV9W0Y6_9ACTN